MSPISSFLFLVSPLIANITDTEKSLLQLSLKVKIFYQGAKEMKMQMK